MLAAHMRVEAICEEPRSSGTKDWRVGVFSFLGGKFQVEITPEQFNELKAFVGQPVTVDCELSHQSVASAKGGFVNDFFRPTRLIRVAAAKQRG